MLILLDIDGVMVPCKPWQSPELAQDGFMQFSKQAIAALQSILNDNTILVLTTSHKENYTLEQWKLLFNNRGIEITEMMISLYLMMTSH